MAYHKQHGEMDFLEGSRVFYFIDDTRLGQSSKVTLKKRYSLNYTMNKVLSTYQCSYITNRSQQQIFYLKYYLHFDCFTWNSVFSNRTRKSHQENSHQSTFYKSCCSCIFIKTFHRLQLFSQAATDYIKKLFWDVVKERKQTGESNDKDLVNHLLKLKKNLKLPAASGTGELTYLYHVNGNYVLVRKDLGITSQQLVFF